VAADQIVNLAETSLKITEEGSGIMKKIIPDIEKTAELVKEIAAASSEQNNGVQQVNLSIQQLNNVTQQNAASSEELSTSSEHLTAQAEELKGIIRFFKLERGKEKTRENIGSTEVPARTENKEPVKKPAVKKPISQGVKLDLPASVNGNGRHKEENFDEVKFY
jgi:methyl-accepting chemotaxis protein